MPSSIHRQRPFLTARGIRGEKKSEGKRKRNRSKKAPLAEAMDFKPRDYEDATDITKGHTFILAYWNIDHHNWFLH
jgi:DNA/RNA endonuclease G (NUC1)